MSQVWNSFYDVQNFLYMYIYIQLLFRFQWPHQDINIVHYLGFVKFHHDMSETLLLLIK